MNRFIKRFIATSFTFVSVIPSFSVNAVNYQSPEDIWRKVDTVKNSDIPVYKIMLKMLEDNYSLSSQEEKMLEDHFKSDFNKIKELWDSKLTEYDRNTSGLQKMTDVFGDMASFEQIINTHVDFAKEVGDRIPEAAIISPMGKWTNSLSDFSVHVRKAVKVYIMDKVIKSVVHSKGIFGSLVSGIAKFGPKIALVGGGILAGKVLLDRALEYYMDWCAQQRKEKAQKNYDAYMKGIFGGSSIDYGLSWKKIYKKIRRLKIYAPHNKKPIGIFESILEGFFKNVQYQLSEKYKKSDYEKNPYQSDHNLLINLWGPPGCGKTSLCYKIGAIFGASYAVTISPRDFDEDHKTLSIKQQINGQWPEGTGDKTYLAYGKLVATLMHNEYPIVILDELEKFPPTFIKLFWDVVDSGKIPVAGKEITCKHAIFLIPSNTPVSEALYRKYSKLIDSDDKNNKELSMLIKSLESRIITIEFNKPTKESYIISLRGVISRIRELVKNKYLLKLKCPDHVIEHLADECIKADIGERKVNHYLDILTSIVTRECERVRRRFGDILVLDVDSDGNVICKTQNGLINSRKNLFFDEKTQKTKKKLANNSISSTDFGKNIVSK